MARMVKTEDGWVLRDDWGVADIQSVAECMEVEITEAQCIEVMETVCQNYDTSTGITWGEIEETIEELLEANA